MSTNAHAFPKLHNAMWPGLVGKGGPGAEPGHEAEPLATLEETIDDLAAECAAGSNDEDHDCSLL